MNLTHGFYFVVDMPEFGMSKKGTCLTQSTQRAKGS